MELRERSPEDPEGVGVGETRANRIEAKCKCKCKKIMRIFFIPPNSAPILESALIKDNYSNLVSPRHYSLNTQHEMALTFFELKRLVVT